jgi:hypothetical protein
MRQDRISTRARLITLALVSPLLAAAPWAAAPARADEMTKAPTTAAGVSDATVGKAGAALRDVISVRENYDSRIQSAETPEQKRGLSEQASAEAVQAIQTHGLSVEEYSRVVRLAQADPQLRQRLLTAAGEKR